MANINSLMSSSSTATSNLYGTRNVLSGLASGMDTESMIENSVSGYKTKITQLEQQQTKYQWKQDAYRSITDKMYELTQSYTSYTSKTNLYSNAFFNNSVSTSILPSGVNAAANVDKVSATGKTSSDIQILAAQTATAARYSVDASALALKNPGTTAANAVSASGTMTVGTLKGSMTLTYGSQTIDIKFDEIDDNNITDAATLQSAIQEKLSKVNISTGNGVKKASDVISVSVGESGGSIGSITFLEKSGYGGNTPFISYVDSSLREKLNLSTITVGNKIGYSIDSVSAPYQKAQSQADYLNNKEISVTLDGVNKTFKLSGLTSSTDAAGNPVMDTSKLVQSLQDGIDHAFGENKVTVRLNNGKLSFDLTNTSSSFAVTAKDAGVGKTLGIGEEGLTSYLNTGASIKTLLGDNFPFSAPKALQAENVVMTAEANATGFYKGNDGNRYKLEGGNYVQVDNNGDAIANASPIASADAITVNNAMLYKGSDGNLYEKDGDNYYKVDDSGARLSGATAVQTSDDFTVRASTLYKGSDSKLYEKDGNDYYQVNSRGNRIYTASNTAKADSSVTMTASTDTDKVGLYNGSDGKLYKKLNDSDYRMVNEKGDFLYDLQINGKSVYVSENSSLDSVINSINASDAGVTASYSRLTGKFIFTAKETGATSQVSFDNDLAKSLFVGDPTQRTLKDVLGLDESAGDFTLNMLGYRVGTFNVNSTLQDVMDVIEDKAAGHGIRNTIVYNSATGTFGTPTAPDVPSSWKFTAYDAQGNAISDTLTADDFFKSVDKVAKSGYAKGTDATVVANVNGQSIMLNRASNTIDMDGLSVNLKGDFGEINANATAAVNAAANAGEAVSFKTTANSDSLVSTITEFIDKYNAVLKEVHDAYATTPAEKSSSTHAKYDPLTDDDKASMSETAIKNYEEKAKQGILFGDSDLSALYSRMVSAFSTGSNASALKEIGITTSYSGGVTQIKIEESKLRAALESNPDKVRDTFTKSKEGGASSDGLMTSIKKTMEQYASTSSATPGILVRKAGSNFSSSSLLNNSVQKQIDNVQTQIERWQKKMSNKIDYYTRQFTALEKLMNTMNSQSSALANLMGGY